MRRLLRRCCESKRECITYVVVFFWIFMGIYGSFFSIDYTHLAAYFLSMTGFIGSYIIGESIRKSEDTSIFIKGPNSRREVMSYLILGIWFVLGLVAMYKELSLLDVSAYFAALTPFVGSYILGETFKQENSDYHQINS